MNCLLKAPPAMGFAHPEGSKIRAAWPSPIQLRAGRSPPGVDPKSPTDLILTVVTGDRAVEVKTYLD